MKSSTNQPRRVPICTLWVHPSGATPLWSLWARPYHTFTKIPLCLFAWFFFLNCILFYFLFRYICSDAFCHLRFYLIHLYHISSFYQYNMWKIICFLSICICCIYNVHEHLTHFRIYLFAKRTKGKILKEDYLKFMRLKSFLFLYESATSVCHIVIFCGPFLSSDLLRVGIQIPLSVKQPMLLLMFLLCMRNANICVNWAHKLFQHCVASCYYMLIAQYIQNHRNVSST